MKHADLGDELELATLEEEEQGAGEATYDVAAHVSGLVRRARRLAKWSQRELAHELGLSQSAVAKWETGRTSPSMRTLSRVLELVGLRLDACRADGRRVRPMRHVAARDAAERRYPAHTYVWAEGWWAPLGADLTNYHSLIMLGSQSLGLPRVRYSRWWQAPRPPTSADIVDHPRWETLVAEARESVVRRPPRLVSVPDWALADSRRSRNRWPVQLRELTRAHLQT